MAWTIKYNEKSEKIFSKLDKQVQIKIRKFLLKLIKSENPRKFAVALKGKSELFWRFRVGDYRIITQIIDNEITILVVKIGHRKEVYR